MLVHRGVESLNPGSRAGYPLQVEAVSVEKVSERHVAVIALYDTGFGLQSADYGLYALSLLGRNVGDFVEKDKVAELNLLNDEVLNVFLVELLRYELFAAVELRL